MADALASLVARLAETAPGLRVETGPGPTGPYAYDASNYEWRPGPWPSCGPSTT